jgi:uncharacterized protein YjiK
MFKKIVLSLVCVIVCLTLLVIDIRSAGASGSANLLDDKSPSHVDDNTLGNIKDFINVKAVNTAITGGVGISGVAFVPEVNLLFLVDNNALNVSIYQLSDGLTTEFGNITFSGFSDTECLEYMYTIYDSNGRPDSAVFVVGEEGLNTMHIFTWDLQATSGTVTKASTTTITPSGMWTLDGSLGMESLSYNPFLNVLYAAKQDTSFEFRRIPLDQGTTPVATEPFDAESLWGATMPGVNDLTYDVNSRTCIAIGDQTGASNNNQDILQFNCETGAIIQHWDNYLDDLGFNSTSTWTQSEGIAISRDGENLFVSSESTRLAWLTRNKNNWQRTINTAVANVGAGEDTLITTFIPSGIQARTGDTIEITAFGTFAANANSKRVECDYGATPAAVIDSGAQTQNGGAWEVNCSITRTSATGQDIKCAFSGPATLFPLAHNFTTDTETMSAALTFDCRGEGVADNDIVQEGLILKYVSGGQ